MHPAYSIIFFTVLSGLGYGLAAVLGLGVLDAAAISTRVAHVLALGMIGAGLLSSTLHLGNPQRAWRALSQWRSSWLSREGVMALASFVPLTIAAGWSMFSGEAAPIAGVLGAAMAMVTVYCTSMIYASLKSIDAWHTNLTSACYLAFSVSGGLVGASFFAFLAGDGVARVLSICACVALGIAWLLKLRWRRRTKTLVPLSTPESATGLGSMGRVRLFEPPHMTANYLTKEMGFKVARKHADKLFTIAVLLGGTAPALFLVGAMLAAPGAMPVMAVLLSGAAFAAHIAGLFFERWLFFAEARHSVMNYYGS
ncbi:MULTISPECIES: dimethyl sulfoxide reductase anchor subunit family protein [Mesorhizobium]|uniref:DMSO reductase n=1 Tax=Mesorhizobium denitrificans TaxID=2294114 RepID=A0A371XFN1_9HYPH|nr:MULTISPECIES: DmsC/YnfH family molybdoenzyme membrane anchor subunit [Mesorhizobium]RFC68037.1 DMSO reductase [Mesorhizobium denitrificans]